MEQGARPVAAAREHPARRSALLPARTRGWLLRAAALGIAALLLLGAGSAGASPQTPSAAAAPGASSPAPEPPAPAARVRRADGPLAGPDDLALAAGSSLTCYLKVHHPHDSLHVRGTINVVGELDCDSIVPLLRISTTLQKRSCTLWILCGWSNVGPTGAVTNSNTDHVSSNSAATCRDGTYRGVSSVYIVWPSGQTASGYDYSASVSINC